MNTSRFLITATTALSVIGAIGFAFAQNTPDKSSGPISSPLVAEPGTTDSQAMPSHPALPEHEQSQTGSTPDTASETTSERERASALRDMSSEKPTGAGESTSGELVARADRN